MAISTAIDASSVAAVTGIQTIFQQRGGTGTFLLPQRVAVLGQGSDAVAYATTPAQFTSAVQVGDAYGFGSPLHLAAKQLFPTNGDGVGLVPVTFYPIEAESGSVAATKVITPAGTATGTGVFYIRINGVRSQPIVVSTGTTAGQFNTAAAAAINAVIDLPALGSVVAATTVATAKWSGSSSQDVYVEVEGPADIGLTFAVTDGAAGTLNPTPAVIDDTLKLFGDIWETMIVSCFEISDTDILDTYSTFNEGRWGALSHNPGVYFTGNRSSTVADATLETDARPLDRTNVSIPVTGSHSLPLEIAARAVARAASLANNIPAHDYELRGLQGIDAGSDSQQWNYAERQQAVLAGSSTTQLQDGLLVMKDTVTTYHPTGDPLPAYRFVVDIVKIQNVLFNISLVFNAPEWSGAPLIADDQPTNEPTAKKPKMAKAAMATMIDGLGLAAILTNTEASKAGILVEVDSQNPKRLNVCVPVDVSGNVNVKSIDLKWSFFLGTGAIVA